MTENKNCGIDILSIDAKDIYISNNYVSDKDNENKRGYNIRFERGLNKGSINTKKFINVLDYSLDLIKLREVYEKVYRNTAFTFQQNGHEYTTKIINVTFKYSNKEFNKVKKDIYVKFGYNINDIELKDNACVIDGVLIAIVINQDIETPLTDSVLGKYFYFEDNQYHVKSNIKTLNTVANLRNILYNGGFYCDGIKYVRFKRSSGSSRVGKCLFIDEKLYSRIHKWEMCGIKIKDNQECDLAALEAYISLTLSSIVDTVEINPENILIIDDHESKFYEDVIETKLNGKWLESKPARVKIKNSIWDGQSIGDESLFSKYPNRGMLLLRNKMCKTAMFNGKIQKWFLDNNITQVSQLNGFTLAKNIKDIKIITTPSSIKYLKFGSIEDWMKNIDTLFGIVKHEKPTPYFGGRMVQTHYQLLNTLQLSEDEMKKFLQPSLDYLQLLKTDPSVVRYHIKYPEDINFNITPLISKNDIVYRLLGINDRFTKTKLYYDFKNDLTKSFVKNLRSGHVLVHGNYSTLLGNGIEMLQQSIGQFNGKSIIGVGNIHSKNFEFNKLLLGSRSPHVTIGNVWLPYNVDNELINKYLNLSKEVVYINSIKESTLDRLSGCDFDSDTVLLTDNKILIEAAEKNYYKFKVPVNHVDSIKRKRKYSNDEKADLDIKTSDNKIGEIINLSQELNTILWHRINNGETYDDIEDLYFDICQLDVMSGIEIDKAKKEFIVDTYAEMKKIKQKWIRNDKDGRMIKPNFFGHLAKTKGYYDSKKKNYKCHDTSMDHLQKIINQFQSKNRGSNKGIKFNPMSSILNLDNYNYNNIFYEQVNRVLDLVKSSSSEINKIYSNEHLTSEEKYKQTSEIRQKTVEYIGNIKLNYSTMVYLVTLCDRNNTNRTILNTLFGYPNTDFFKVIKESKEPIEILVENVDGKIKIYDFNYTKTYKN